MPYSAFSISQIDKDGRFRFSTALYCHLRYDTCSSLLSLEVQVIAMSTTVNHRMEDNKVYGRQFCVFD